MKFGGIVAANGGCLSLTLGLCSSFSFSFGFLLVIDEVSWNRRDTCKIPAYRPYTSKLQSGVFVSFLSSGFVCQWCLSELLLLLLCFARSYEVLESATLEEMVERLNEESNIYQQADILNHLFNTGRVLHRP